MCGTNLASTTTSNQQQRIGTNSSIQGLWQPSFTTGYWQPENLQTARCKQGPSTSVYNHIKSTTKVGDQAHLTISTNKTDGSLLSTFFTSFRQLLIKLQHSGLWQPTSNQAYGILQNLTIEVFFWQPTIHMNENKHIHSYL